MKNHVFVVTFMALLVSMSATLASEEHHHDSHKNNHKSDTEMNHNNHNSDSHQQSGMSHDKGDMFLVKKNIDGYQVSFHVMKARPGKEMGGSHDFMIKVEKAGMTLSSIAMNTKVIHPDGTAESKKVMKMGDWFMAGYDLGHKGKHQMMVLFKTKDGKKHMGGVYY
jgi:hypothetical protein